MFMVYWRPQDWLIPVMYGWPILDVVVAVAMLAFLLELDQGRVRFPRGVPQVYLVVGLWFATMMSHVAHTYFAALMTTIPETFKFCLFTVLLLCVLDSIPRLQRVTILLVAMAGTMAVHALLQEFRGYGFAGLPPLYQVAMGNRPGWFRTYFFGIFGDPNDMAQLLASSVPFAFAVWRRQSLLTLLGGVAVAWLLARSALSTQSRGGVVALVIVGAFLLMLTCPPRWLPFLLTIGAAVALALCPFAGGFMDESARERVVFWGTANQVFRAHPFFGVGYGLYADYIEEGRSAHNAFVLCYTSLGVFGYWFWFGLIQLGMVGAWRTRLALRWNPDPDARWLYRFSGLAMAAMMGFAASSYFLARTFLYPLFFLVAMLGVLPSLARPFLPEDAPPMLSLTRDVLVMVSVGTVVSIAYIYVSILLLNRAWYG